MEGNLPGSVDCKLSLGMALLPSVLWQTVIDGRGVRA